MGQAADSPHILINYGPQALRSAQIVASMYCGPHKLRPRPEKYNPQHLGLSFGTGGYLTLSTDELNLKR